MFSCLQILEAFLWFVLITLLNVTLIILTLSVSRLLNLLLRLVDRKSGSAGMPRPISYAVFCLKKKKNGRSGYLLTHGHVGFATANRQDAHVIRGMLRNVVPE